MESRLFVTYLTTKNHAMTPLRRFMRGTMEELNLCKVIYVGLSTIVNFGVNKAKQRNISLDSENRLSKQRTKSAFGLEAFVLFI